MALATQPYKGARDFYPPDKRLQKYLFSVMREAAERFGYEEYDAPILEPLEIYLAKSNAEIVSEQTYAFTDRGGRQVVIRPEMTPTVSRMVAAQRQELSYPLRWYSIPNVWRYERPQRGRLREHWQLNIDLFGIAGLEAELEVIQVADNLLKSYGAKRSMYAIKLNHRQLMRSLLHEYFGLDAIQATALGHLIDRFAKMEPADFTVAVNELLLPQQREKGLADKLLELLKIKNLDELPPELAANPAVAELRQVVTRLADQHIDNVEFDITLMRGFDYYSGLVFEVFDTSPENNRSLFGGGRYDGLVELFGAEPLPSVGFGVGDVTLEDFLTTHDLAPDAKTETDIYVVLIGDVNAERAQKPIAELREMGLNVAVDFSGKKADAQIKSAVKKGVTYVLFIGEKELAEEHYTVKNLQTGDEERHSLQRIVSLVKDHRKP
jgi:histidyl-tRNA synthetase